jgi:hypothetical protein
MDECRRNACLKYKYDVAALYPNVKLISTMDEQ